MFFRGFSALALVFSLLPAPAGQAQSTNTPPGSSPSSQAPAFTIRAESRVVLTDVTVTDHHGNPVRGLPASAFHIFDNNEPQKIDSFEQHSEASAAPALSTTAAPSGAYSNDYLLHLPEAVNIFVIDITNINVPDQMYLNYQLTKFLDTLPANQPIALYLRGGSGSVLLQNFTSDHELLKAALHKAIPRIPPFGREYISDLATLQQLAAYLTQVPGRKNILWFTGGSTLFLRADATVVQDYAAWRGLYDLLEQERIAIYPIDARGLTVAFHPAMFYQQGLMNDVAEATGGKAYYNNNGLKEISSQILQSDGSFYTITYAPSNFHFDNKWHKVRIVLDEKSYQLSYRRGYFADGSHPNEKNADGKRTALFAGGEKVDMPDVRTLPLVFLANVVLASAPGPLPPGGVFTTAVQPVKKGEIPYLVRYSVPAGSFTQRSVDGKPQVVFAIAAVVFNADGRVVGQQGDRITSTLNPVAVQRNPNAPLNVDQNIVLHKGDDFLYLAMWDMTTGRVGTLQIHLNVLKNP
jgi:VWFA-related protein